MSVQSEINRLQQNISNAFAAVRSKGGTVPSSKVSGNLASAILSIPEGVELNFNVVGGRSRPSDPEENTIWIDTETISSWVFSAEQPNIPADNMVWIKTGSDGSFEFNALKENEIQIVLSGSKQYVSGAWENVGSEIYIDGSWEQLSIASDGTLYEPGNQHTDITGGWGISGWASGIAAYSLKAATIDNSGISLGYEQNKMITAGTANKINLSEVNTLFVTVAECPSAAACYFAAHKEKKVGYSPLYNMDSIITINGPGEFSLDVRGMSEGYIAFFSGGYPGATIKVTKIRMG